MCARHYSLNGTLAAPNFVNIAAVGLSSPRSIRDNVAFAPRLLGWSSSRIKEVVRQSLERAALWDKVRDRLDEPATSLSGGQQQRLAIARL